MCRHQVDNTPSVSFFYFGVSTKHSLISKNENFSLILYPLFLLSYFIHFFSFSHILYQFLIKIRAIHVWDYFSWMEGVHPPSLCSWVVFLFGLSHYSWVVSFFGKKQQLFFSFTLLSPTLFSLHLSIFFLFYFIIHLLNSLNTTFLKSRAEKKRLYYRGTEGVLLSMLTIHMYMYIHVFHTSSQLDIL